MSLLDLGLERSGSLTWDSCCCLSIECVVSNRFGLIFGVRDRLRVSNLNFGISKRTRHASKSGNEFTLMIPRLIALNRIFDGLQFGTELAVMNTIKWSTESNSFELVAATIWFDRRADRTALKLGRNLAVKAHQLNWIDRFELDNFESDWWLRRALTSQEIAFWKSAIQSWGRRMGWMSPDSQCDGAVGYSGYRRRYGRNHCIFETIEIRYIPTPNQRQLCNE